MVSYQHCLCVCVCFLQLVDRNLHGSSHQHKRHEHVTKDRSLQHMIWKSGGVVNQSEVSQRAGDASRFFYVVKYTVGMERYLNLTVRYYLNNKLEVRYLWVFFFFLKKQNASTHQIQNSHFLPFNGSCHMSTTTYLDVCHCDTVKLIIPLHL